MWRPAATKSTSITSCATSSRSAGARRKVRSPPGAAWNADDYEIADADDGASDSDDSNGSEEPSAHAGNTHAGKSGRKKKKSR